MAKRYRGFWTVCIASTSILWVNGSGYKHRPCYIPSPGISDMASSVGDAGGPEVQGAAGVAKGAAAFTKMASSLMKTFSQLRMVHMCGLSTYEHERYRLVSSAVVRAHFPPSRVRLFSFLLI